MALLNLFMHNYFRHTMKRFQKNTVCICKNLPSLSIFDFNLDSNIKNQLYQSGNLAAEEFIKNVLDINVLYGELE